MRTIGVEVGKKRSIGVEVGKTYGRLTVLSIEEKTRKCRTRFCLVQCSCGSPPKDVRVKYLKSGKTKSCGCLQQIAIKNSNYDRWENDPRNDRVGQRQGYLTVTKRDYSKKNANNIYWICRCKCGRDISVNASRLSFESDRRIQKCRKCYLLGR